MAVALNRFHMSILGWLGYPVYGYSHMWMQYAWFSGPGFKKPQVHSWARQIPVQAHLFVRATRPFCKAAIGGSDIRDARMMSRPLEIARVSYPPLIITTHHQPSNMDESTTNIIDKQLSGTPMFKVYQRSAHHQSCSTILNHHCWLSIVNQHMNNGINHDINHID